MNKFQRIAHKDMGDKDYPVPDFDGKEREARIEASRRGAENLARMLELSTVAELTELAAIAGWNGARFKAEAEVMGIAIRFREAVKTGAQERAWAAETGCMIEILKTGPVALAGLNQTSLVKLIPETILGATSGRYDPFSEGGRLVLGPTGTGKSVTGVCVLRRLLGVRASDYAPRSERIDCYARREHRVMAYVRAFDLPNARLALKLGTGEADLVDRAARADFLVLDDIGWESKRAGADDVVLEVIAARYDAGKPTYATTGLRLEQFEQRYGSAVVRRLTEAGGLPGAVIDLWRE